MSFIEKLRAAQTANRSCVCVGLDPDVTKFPPHVGQSGSDILSFCQQIVDATADVVSAYKPNLAYFLSHGAVGVDTLRQVIAHIPQQVPVILDAKFGDIGHTAAQYAAFAFEHLRADAVTASPYIGTDALKPFLAYPGKLIFALCRTSNTDGNEFQTWPDAQSPLYKNVAEQMVSLSTRYPDQIGLVVGATQVAEFTEVRALAPDLPFLVPGVGAQGGDLAAVVRSGMTHNGISPVINTGRAVLYASQDSDFAQIAREKVIALNAEIDTLRAQHAKL
jgi:orotidine-5'-phosphate decarboxylase